MRDVRRAWWCCLLFLPSAVAALAVAGVVASAPAGRASGPLPVLDALTAGPPAGAVFVVPVVVVRHFTVRAQRQGSADADAPLVAAVVVSVLFLVQNLLALGVGSTR
jgi:hypothetical protein